MDSIYQALKNFLKSFVNLFVAIVELFAGLINGLAALLVNIRPRPRKLKNGAAAADQEKTGTDSELICQIRKELEKKITDRDAYILIRADIEIFEGSILKRAFAGRKRKLSNAVTKVLLEEEFKDIFLKEETETKIQAICEVSKEAIS